MSLTGHNQFFGWVHSFKINRNNLLFRATVATERPFPIIVESPTIGQVLDNWNYADTGLIISSFGFGLLLGKIMCEKEVINGLLHRKFFFKRITNLVLFAGLFFALNNSSNRLQGFVPNGLPSKRTEEVLKYDYTS
jgi:hypothetical protein